MSELDTFLISAGSIATPASGMIASFADLDKITKTKDSNGFVRSVQSNQSIASQAPAATTRTYITGSKIALAAANRLQASANGASMFRWRFNMTKTAAGIAASTFDIAFGTAGTTADTAQISFTKPAGTAAVDEAFVEIECTVRSINASTGTVSGEFTLVHNGNTVGHATIPSVVLHTTSGNFDTTTPTFVGLCITSGASDAITIEQIQAEAWNV